MKLFYSAGSCSTSCHITLEESGLPYEAVEVDWENEKDPNLSLIRELNPLGTLPVFLNDDGQVLAQNVAIHTYIAERVPQRGLLPPAGTWERAEAMHWLSVVSSDLHKSFSPLFALGRISPDAKVHDAVRAWSAENVNECLAYLDARLEGREYVMGKTFTVIDAYAFVVVNWTQWVGIPLAPYKNLTAYQARVRARPAVERVWKTEGL